MPKDQHAELFGLMTGAAVEDLSLDLQEFSDKQWKIFGVARIVVVGVTNADDSHRHVLACEYDSASYPVDSSGAPVFPVENRWLPQEYWFVFADEQWKLEQFYRGTHECEGLQ
jgi:hypothetical protein